jgi:hypothetical protein
MYVVEVVDPDSSGDLPTARVKTPAGRIEIMAVFEFQSRTILAREAHIQSDAGPNAFGAHTLRRIVSVLLEQLDHDHLVVEGAVRTTGAGPGRRPGRLRFSRNPRPPTA